MTKLAFAGDWHGHTAWAETALNHLKEQGVEAVVHVGDLAVLWETDNPEWCRMVQTIHRAGVPFYFIDGNHDRHDILHDLPAGEGNLYEGVTYMHRGSTMSLGGLTLGFLGGAYSIDKDWRTEGMDWWPNEEPTLGNAMGLMGHDIDILVTHDAPLGASVKKTIQLPQKRELESARTRELVHQVMEATEPRLLYCGHWHQYHTERVGKTQVTVLHMENKYGNFEIIDTEDLT